MGPAVPIHRKGIDRCRAVFVLALTASAFALPFGLGAQPGQLPRAGSVVQPAAYVSLQPVPRNRSFEIAVVGRISPGFHVNAHEPSDKYLIPTEISADLPPGIVLVDARYPDGVTRNFRFSKTPLRVYENSFTVRLMLRTEAGVPLGPQKIRLTLGYQPCTQEACLQPTSVPVVAELEIAPLNALAHPTNTKIFTTASPARFHIPQ